MQTRQILNNNSHPFETRSFKRAILHIDADSFFASCEQAVNPKYKGLPLITGKERGIASAVSIEAKKIGIKRGMTMREIRAIAPNIIYLPSDYETYSLFSRRMFSIVRRYTELVEEYSIDECFAEITGLRRSLKMSYSTIAKKIKHDLDIELGITFSIGLGPSKVVAKLGSKYDKPSGLVIIPAKNLHIFLNDISVGDVWGIGPQTTARLRQFGITTALQFAQKESWWIQENFAKPYCVIWHELRGKSLMPLELNTKHDYQSISKTKTFTPPSKDRHFILAQLSKNTENACIKARRHGLLARRVYFLLRLQNFQHNGYEIILSRYTANPSEIISLIDAHLDKIFKINTFYRLTGIVLADLKSNTALQLDLFGDALRASKLAQVYAVTDLIDARYGKHTIYLGSSMRALTNKQHTGERSQQSRRAQNLFKGEDKRKKLNLPMLGSVK